MLYCSYLYIDGICLCLKLNRSIGLHHWSPESPSTQTACHWKATGNGANPR